MFPQSPFWGKDSTDSIALSHAFSKIPRLVYTRCA